MTHPFKVLYVGPAKSEAFDTATLEQQSRAVLHAGGSVIRYGGNSTAELIQALEEVDVAMLQGHGFERAAFAHMGLHGRCKGLVSFGHGYDHLDLDAATSNGVMLANTASFGTEEVSNHTMMHFLVCARKFVLHDKLVRSGVWTRKHLGPMGHVAGQVFGIVGLGDIGRAVARKAKAFGLQVIAFDPYVASWDALESGAEMMASLEELCRRADYLSVHVYLNPETRHLISRAQFAVMKASAYLINCSRGGVVDEAALIEALQQQRIAGAGLDVFEKEPVDPANPLLQMDNVSLTNHYASYSEVAWERAQTQLGEEAVRIATGMWPMSLINPDVRHVVPSRAPARSWEVYARELSGARHR
ncbi:MAG TPA: C-terminal binding protein [Rhodanobacteraceae bacterium]|nr:C-terminal binding protein [Rhodanobacteraceae bacterium]